MIFLFTREININIYNQLYLFINKLDYLSDTLYLFISIVCFIFPPALCVLHVEI